MARGMIIMGASGSGKTTLGHAVADALKLPYFDIDDYIWRRDTAEPYTVMYSRAEKIGRLKADLAPCARFVMAGSMSSFHAEFDPMFDFAVFLKADRALRLERVQRRAEERFGSRVLEGGDMAVNHRKMIDNVSRYETDGSPNLTEQTAWFESLSCPKIVLNGGDPLEVKLRQTLQAYKTLPFG